MAAFSTSSSVFYTLKLTPNFLQPPEHQSINVPSKHLHYAVSYIYTVKSTITHTSFDNDAHHGLLASGFKVVVVDVVGDEQVRALSVTAT